MSAGVLMLLLGAGAGLGPLVLLDDPSPGAIGLSCGMLLICWSFGMAAVLMGRGVRSRPPVAK